jgi:putative tryptophan/tyrosine transport system substrate-binding protein
MLDQRRRDFIGALCGAAAAGVAWPLAARAQQPAMPVIGFLNVASAQEFAPQVTNFHKGLAEAGYREGRNVAIEYRWADGQYSKLAQLAAELVRRPVAVLVATGGLATSLAAKEATASIPIVFSIGSDPVRYGLVASLSRPGGNVTGVSFQINELVAKQLDVLAQLLPAAKVFAFLVNPDNPNTETDTRAIKSAADRLGLRILLFSARTAADLDATLPSMPLQGADALMISSDPFFVVQHARIAELATRQRLPAMFGYRQGPRAGALASYGASIVDGYRYVGIYTGRILKGEKPADLPVMQPTKFQLVLNLKTAKALGLTVPDKLLALADEVIE